MDILLNILKEIWSILLAMAPYLLLGFLMAGILSALISRDFVRRHLGGGGWVGSLSTFARLGWVFAVFRAFVAFVSGVLCGMAVTAVSTKDDVEQEEDPDASRNPNCKPALQRMLVYGFVSLPRDIGKAMVLGIVISGIISGLIPPDFFAGRFGDSPFAMLMMLVIGIPLYVCSSASVPIALAFIKAGISPGAALVFLITGPATNAATLTTLWQIIGKRQLAVFLVVLAANALAAGFL